MLTPAERKALKIRAHELIKVRAGGFDRHRRDGALISICGQTKAEQVQHVGKVFVLFRKNEKADE
jgi:RNA-binding protein